MNGRFVKMTGNPAVADYTKDKKHFKYLTPTPDEEAALVAEAIKWMVYSVQQTKVSYDEFGDYNLETKYYRTRLDDYHGDIIIDNGKVWGVVNSSRIIKRGQELVEKFDSWESRAVYYYTTKYSIIRVDEK